MSKLKETYENIEGTVVNGYKKIENTVVNSYKNIENNVVDSFQKVSDNCINKMFSKEGESIEETKERLSKNIK